MYNGNNEKIQLVDNKTDYIFINTKEKEEQSYKLKIMYDKIAHQLENGREILDDIQIKVHSEQQNI